jgi:hypothetical protein
MCLLLILNISQHLCDQSTKTKIQNGLFQGKKSQNLKFYNFSNYKLHNKAVQKEFQTKI